MCNNVAICSLMLFAVAFRHVVHTEMLAEDFICPHPGKQRDKGLFPWGIHRENIIVAPISTINSKKSIKRVQEAPGGLL